jgi:uncharacterized protein YndB with AHSA1/START domain
LTSGAESEQKGGVSDAAVRAATGRGWDEWFAILDDAGANQMSHPEIVAQLHANYDVSAWWEQQITVAYEQERGLREQHESPRGYEISRTRTMSVPIDDLYRAFADATIRGRWLPEEVTDVRETTPGQSIWMTWSDGQTQVNARFVDKGNAKSTVTVQHTKLPDSAEATRMKAYWSEALGRLWEMLGPA